ncbi:tetratricopeptide repeat protein [Acidithiobacillus sp. 'AMD consortium']|uniref:Lipopolysaccharide assembly protein B n=2 Tax=Acidithiobacillus ferridurans TaxID=1232575 RepID=A0A2Z6IKB4_ACIFI|nr:tetratricopeptide repeat protein [Acidithiobacillus ferridurans]QFG78113.1 tetratricopeptide repeat protein [Acidithiobacillus sp. 'AMD consortium']MBU2724102.1 tetratricopeptide repeat protein [Acidithiobacillus ferridurans]MBU2725755.1 tetratricopeptide repeat protein [Acidithiobacillus ferridurans]MBU2732103.1 tetratricopeptide repeat protein [Acidithiobacillus ferridurans]
MVDTIVVLVLLLAIALGVWIGRVTSPRKPAPGVPDTIPEIYIQGLNHLLSERNDEAVEVFLDALRQHPESVDILLALGRLFRRRGELERALRVHQYLLDQPALASDLRQSVLFEIAQDYLKAGILDRAESILKELLDRQPDHLEGLATLAELYELGSEWAKSIAVRQQLHKTGTHGQRPVIAMLYGELAEQSLLAGETEQAGVFLGMARKEDPENPRALVVGGRIAFDRRNWDDAFDLWRKLLDSRVESVILLVLEPFLSVLPHVANGVDAQKARERLLDMCRSPLAVKLLAHALQGVEGTLAATTYLRHLLLRQPDMRVMQVLLELDPEAPDPTLYPVMAMTVRGLSVEPVVFHCQTCGYQSPQYYWRCPSCRQWGTFSGGCSL